MKVVLAGYNIESEIIERASKELGLELTPEVISAAYARISRDPRNVGTLRQEAREEVSSARKSNESIVFGLGHSSVAEHAVFNFDVMRISRLAVEAIEHFRLASFTEKSQRYIRLGKDYTVPKELEDAGYKNEFETLMEILAGRYDQLYKKILDSGEKRSVAKEDARYLMPLATTAQFGMTLNARELEYMISRLASHPLDELRRFAGHLSRLSRAIAPSLVKYPKPTEYFRSVPEIRAGFADRINGDRGRPEQDVALVHSTGRGDLRVVASILFSSCRVSYAEALEEAHRMGKAGRKEIIERTMSGMMSFDGVWREFENIHMLFEVVVSASCYAQLKRHRMATQILQDYDISLGTTIPPSVVQSGSVGLFRKAIGESEKHYRKLRGTIPEAADYVLTNAHRRRVLLDINMRELYHFSRLRSDRHAQWDIRALSEEMCRLASDRYPLSSVFLGGKDIFESLKNR